ncbi:MAG: hypothetical protein NZM37_02565 [Sandaracinaceae bacterium]|nr:hypothetical protein [Sandaracinaceae bacterium]
MRIRREGSLIIEEEVAVQPGKVVDFPSRKPELELPVGLAPPADIEETPSTPLASGKASSPQGVETQGPASQEKPRQAASKRQGAAMP